MVRVMNRRTSQLRLLHLMAAALFLSACTPWLIIRQSGPPSAIAGAQQVVLAVDYSQLMVGAVHVDQYRNSRGADEIQAFEDVLQAMADSFFEEAGNRMGVPVTPAAGPPAEGEVRVTFRPIYMVQGKYAVVYKEDSELRSRIVWSVGPQEVDEIETYIKVGASLTRPAIIQRMKIASAKTGRWAASFFERAQAE